VDLCAGETYLRKAPPGLFGKRQVSFDLEGTIYGRSIGSGLTAAHAEVVVSGRDHAVALGVDRAQVSWSYGKAHVGAGAGGQVDARETLECS